MVITRTPFRISLFGGSTDYKSFYSKHGSLLIGSSIQQYMYLAIQHRHDICGEESIFNYSKQERVKNHLDLQHPVLRAVFKYYSKRVAMSLFADVPARTGLGGSSTFSVGLLHALKRLDGIPGEAISRKSLAWETIQLERETLNEAGGIQDQI